MTTDLWYLALAAGLTAALWIPYIACQVMTNGLLAPENYVDPKPRPVPAVGPARAPRLPERGRELRAVRGAGHRPPTSPARPTR